MSEQPITEEQLQPRAQAEIKAELDQVELAYSKLDDKFALISKKFQSLSKTEQDKVTNFGNKFEQEDVTDEDIDEAFSKDTRKLMYEFRQLITEVKALEAHRGNLQKEYLPYKRKEFEESLSKLASRVNYDAVFDYYREIYQYKRERLDSSDLFATATELYLLRRYQHEELNRSSKSEDFDYFDRGIRNLQYFEEQWHNRGFLRDASNPNYKSDEQFGELVRKQREQIAEAAGKTIEQLEEYGTLIRIYRPSLFNNREHIDHSLNSVYRLLDQGGDYLYASEKFEEVDFDPNFLQAAARHIEKVIEEHKRAGRIPKSEAAIQADRERIDSIEPGKIFDKIVLEGFDVPKGMRLAVDPQEILAEARKLIPPDFATNLSSITHKPIPEKEPDDDPHTETMGRFIPIFVKGNQWDQIQATEIEVYRDLFVPMDVDEIEIKLVRSYFMGTIWHEFGHNAHYTLDYDEMVGWEKTIAEDATAVTWYVKYSRAKDEKKGKREDFSESFKLYLTEPALLYVLSPARFAYMNNFFHRHLPTAQRDDFDQYIDSEIMITHLIWKINNYSQTDIRDRYLSHEEE